MIVRGWGCKKRLITKGHKEPLRWMELFCILILAMAPWLGTLVKTYETVRNKGWIWLQINYTSIKKPLYLYLLYEQSIHRHCLIRLSWRPCSNQACLLIFSANCFSRGACTLQLCFLLSVHAKPCLPTHHSSQIVLAKVTGHLLFCSSPWLIFSPDFLDRFYQLAL